MLHIDDLTTTLALRTLSPCFVRHVDVLAAFPHSITEGRVLDECHDVLEEAISQLAYENFRFADGSTDELAVSWNNLLQDRFGYTFVLVVGSPAWPQAD